MVILKAKFSFSVIIPQLGLKKLRNEGHIYSQASFSDINCSSQSTMNASVLHLETVNVPN